MDEGPPVADLRLHTTTSDGRLTVDTLPDAARASEVDMVVVTDHDRYHPGLDASMVKRDSVTVVRGIELRVNTDDRRVNLLEYGLRERPVLVETVGRLQRDRVERARKVIAAVEEKTGVRLEIDTHDGVNRSHVARAIDANEAPRDYQGALDELIDADGPCYVARELPTFNDGVATLRDACGVIGLAHPFRYRNPAGALELYTDLDAVERYHPYGFDVEASLVEKAVKRYDLLTAGGSDARDETLGYAGPPETDFARFAAAVDDL